MGTSYGRNYPQAPVQSKWATSARTTDGRTTLGITEEMQQITSCPEQVLYTHPQVHDPIHDTSGQGYLDLDAPPSYDVATAQSTRMGQ